MPRTLSLVLTQALNDLESTDPLVWLFELDSPGVFPAPVRFVSDVQSITFQGATFQPFPVNMDAVGENTIGERERIRGVVANVDQQVISLLEHYWITQIDPLWTVTIWQVLRSDPDQVPVTDGEIYEVLGATTDFLTVTFEMEQAGIPSRQRSTGRRYTETGGFPNIPRI